jgi:hypothetical protein
VRRRSGRRSHSGASDGLGVQGGADRHNGGVVAGRGAALRPPYGRHPTGPALIWLALEFGPGYAIEAATGSIAACALCALFALAYDRASRRAGVAVALTLATGAAVLVALPLHWLCTGLALALAAAGAAAIAVFAAMPEGEEDAAPVSRLRGELAFTALASGAVSGVVSLAAPSVGPFWAGVLASPPLIAAAVAMHQHVFTGHASVRRFLRGYVAGLLGRAAFGAGFALLIAPIGLASAALVASAAGCALTTGALRLFASLPARRF